MRPQITPHIKYGIALLLLVTIIYPVFTQSWLQSKSPNHVNVVGRIPLQDEVWEERLVLFFDQEIEIPDSPLSFDPIIDGHWQTFENGFSFKPEKLPEDELFKVTIHPELKSKSGDPINPDQREFYLSTANMEVKNVWLIEEEAHQYTFGAIFPYPVNPEKVKEYLSIKANDEEISYQIESGKTEDLVRITITQVEDWPISFHFEAGLPDKTGHLETKNEVVKKYPEDRFVAVKQVHWSEINPEFQEFTLTFNYPVRANDLAKHLQVIQARERQRLDATVTTKGLLDRHTVRISTPNPGDMTIRIQIDKGLQSERGRELDVPYRTTLHHREDPLRIASIRWRTYGEEGNVLQIRFNKSITPFNTTEELKEHVQIFPPIEKKDVEFGRYNEINIKGKWEEGLQYEVQFTEGLKHSELARLSEALSTQTQAPEVRPWLQFDQQGKYYYPLRDGMGISLKTRKIESLDVTLYRLFPSNIAVAVENMNNGKGGDWFNRKWCEQISSQEISLEPKGNETQETLINIDDFLPSDRRGVFCLSAHDGDNRYRDTRLILFTDTGVLAHWRNQELAVFVHDLFSLTPANHAKVTLYSSKNQIMGEGRTGYEGTVQINDLDTRLGLPHVLVVEHGDDYTFLKLDPRREGRNEINAIQSSYSAKAYDGFIYADRDLYRPGETIHLHWIVRRNYGDSVGAIPLQLKILKPNGKEILTEAVELDEFGSGGIDFQTQDVYPTGEYRANLLIPGSEKAIGSYRFRLEEFVPNRMKVDVKTSSDHWVAGQAESVTIEARHLFGAPAVDRKCEAELFFRSGEKVTLDQWNEYYFGNDSNYTPERISLGEHRTNEEGQVSLNYTYKKDLKLTSPIPAYVVGRAFELGGRSINARESIMVSPSEVLLGLMTSPLPGGKGMEVHIAAVNQDQTAADLDQVKVTLERQVWDYYVRRYYSHNQPDFTESFREVETKEVSLSQGRGSVSFTPEEYGYYRVRVHSDQTEVYSTRSFYAYGGRCNVIDDAKPSLITLSVDQSRYQVGDTARIRVESPFDGRAVVAIQDEEIRKIFSQELKNKAAEFELPITEEDYPNVWVEATVIHYVEAGQPQIYPYSSFAIENLEVDHPQRQLKITCDNLPEEIKPSSSLTVDIKSTEMDHAPAQSKLTVALVDEGIHMITNYQSPAPYDWFGRSRRPDFRRTHYYDNVVYDFDKWEPGGDGALMAKRVSSSLENWIKPVALWSGVVKTNSEGEASVTFDVPEYTGELRLVIVAYDEDSVGAYEEAILVRRDFDIRTSLPRFLLPKDESRIHATFFNHSDQISQAKLSWKTEGALKNEQGKQELMIPAQGENSLVIPLTGGNLSGQGTLSWEAIFEDEQGRVIERLEKISPIPVEPPAAFQSHFESQWIEPGDSLVVRNNRFVDNELAEIEITVGAHASLQLQEALSYLIRYPYGCVEQATSRLMPMYLLRKNANLMNTTLDERTKLDIYIQNGIDKLFSMQTHNGGLGSWPGSNHPYAYGSVYAFHFLTLVNNEREFDVPKTSYNALKDYVKELGTHWSRNSESHLYLRAYAAFTLALAGDLESIEQIHRFDTISIPRAARYLLAAAIMKTTQDRDRVARYLTETPSKPYRVSEPDETLNSDIRNTAVELISLLEMEREPTEITQRVQKLVQFLQTNYHGNTQETAFVVTALGEYLSRQSQNLEEAKARIEYQHEDATSERIIQREDIYEEKHDGKGGTFVIENTGEVRLIANITTRGIPLVIEKEPVDEGIKVRREFFNSKGETWNQLEFIQGESYIVDLQVQCDQKLKNVIVADLLPAGFEVENPRLDPSAAPQDFFEDSRIPTHLEIRDDRVVLAFDEIEEGENHFYYIVRAITPGTYQYPRLQAECMYLPTIYGTSELTSMKVEEFSPSEE